MVPNKRRQIYIKDRLYYNSNNTILKILFLKTYMLTINHNDITYNVGYKAAHDINQSLI